jgi:hypothetical protein
MEYTGMMKREYECCNDCGYAKHICHCEDPDGDFKKFAEEFLSKRKGKNLFSGDLKRAFLAGYNAGKMAKR